MNQPPPAADADTRAAVEQFVNVNTPAETRALLREKSHLLCTAAAEQLIQDLLTRYQENAEAIGILEHRLDLVQRCRAQGVSHVLAEPDRAVAHVVLGFVNADTWQERRARLEQDGFLLLSDEADQALDYLIRQYQAQPETVARLENDRHLLQTAAELGLPSFLQTVRDRLALAMAEQEPDLDPTTRIEQLSEILALSNASTEPGVVAHWSLTLAEALRTREDEQSIEQAITLLQDVLPVLEPQPDLADQYFSVHVQLGYCYEARLSGGSAANTRRAITHYQQALARVDRRAEPRNWAAVQLSLGNAFKAIGAEEADYEQAIAHYQAALQVFKRADYPQDWAGTQHMLGNACLLLGREQPERLEQAIEYFEQALTIITPDTDPQNWLGVQIVMAQALEDQGRRAEAEAQLRLAVASVEADLALEPWSAAALQLAVLLVQPERSDVAREEGRLLYGRLLELLSPEDFAERWATVQRNLGDVYRRRTQGARVDNLEQALYHTQQALRVWSRDEYAYEWAQLQHNLAAAYYERLAGERADNLEQCLAHGRQALTIHTAADYPRDHAMTCGLLGMALVQRLSGTRAENVEAALESFQQALSLLQKEQEPFLWAESQNGLGGAYLEREAGERRQNLASALAHFQEAASVYTQSAYPERWMQVQNNLGFLHMELAELEPAHFEEAVDHLRQAAGSISQLQAPYYWAMFQRNLAAALINGRGTTMATEALAALQAALTVFAVGKYPADFRTTQTYVGHVHFLQRNWAPALEAYQLAIEAGEALLQQAYTAAGRQSEVKEVGTIHARTAYCLLQLGRPSDALLAIEGGRARLMAEALAMSDTSLSQLPDSLRQQLQQRWDAIQLLEAEMHQPASAASRRLDAELGTLLKDAREQWREVVNQANQILPQFGPQPLQQAQLLALSPAAGALVVPLVTTQGGAVFVIPHGAGQVTDQHLLWLPELTSDALQELLIGTEEAPGWLRGYVHWLNERTEATQEAWQKLQVKTARQLWSSLVSPILERLSSLGIAPGAPLLIMPPGHLGLLPLHAAWRPVGGRPRALLDDHPITYAPGGYALQAARHRLQAQDQAAASLLAVINPTGDLPFTPLEGLVLERLFAGRPQSTRAEAAATRAEILTQAAEHSYLHFSSHGYYGWQAAHQSGLVLHDKPLTLDDILARLRLRKTRLVVLSACETGMTEFQETPDEFIGLSAGFLQAGAPGVISTLWAVNDLSTALLMEQFYARHLAGEPPATALQQAQLWLRDTTAEELAIYFRGQRRVLRQAGRHREPIYEAVANAAYHFEDLPAEHTPYAAPYFWAPFTFTGV